MVSNNENSALLIMDVQAGIVGNLPNAEQFVNRVAKALAHARQKSIRVIYVTVGFRKGAPEIGPDNKNFAASKARFEKVNEEEFTAIHPAVKPMENDVTIRKRRFSAFTGSDLEVILRANDIKHLILTGCSTSGVVLSTTREAADKDYRLTILADACTDPDEKVHHVLINKVFPKQADVITINDWISNK